MTRHWRCQAAAAPDSERGPLVVRRRGGFRPGELWHLPTGERVPRADMHEAG